MPVGRSLWPREHGAYAQLLAPLATALALQPPTLAAGLLALAACCAFLANEPLLVVLGHRGRRMRELAGRRAAIHLAVIATAAAIAGAAGLALASRDALGVAAIVALPAAAVVALAWTRAEHSLAGELVAAVALPGAAAPVAVASGVAPTLALAVWLAWAIGYACTVVAVHRVIARHRRPATRIDRIAAIGIATIAVAAAALALSFAPALLAVPLALASAVLVVRPPRATYLRAIGVALVVASLATGALAVISIPA